MAKRAESIALRTDFSLLIDGRLETSSEHLDVINPALGEVFARCPAATREHLDRAVAAARSAFPAWRDKSFADRAALIKKMSQRLREKQNELAELLTREQGKPLAQSVAEIDRGAAQSDGMVGIEIPVEVLADDKDKHIELRYRPLGVVGIITPWNAPVNLALGPLVSALYTGNTVVLKPSPYTPLATLKVAELLREVFPAGVVNVLAGGDQLGAWITEHPDIDKISFTGSVATGKKVLASAAATLKRVTLELGGNDPAIIMDDVDPKAVAKKIFFASFVNSGQVCMAIKRIYAHEKIYDALCDALVVEAKKAKVGDGLDPATELGPIQNKMQYDKVVSIIEDTKKRGAKILSGGEVPKGPGYFLPPTLVTDIDEDSRLVREEQFGPIVPILKFSSLDDVLRRANDTRYGLSGSVWTSDVTRGAEIAAKLEVGTAWVNQHRATSAFVPFGGAKESGLGRQYSSLGLKSYMEPEVVSVAKQ
jgi:acyl-CoA reductase-like NAD-dependent aldehyde dehydrogenase